MGNLAGDDRRQRVFKSGRNSILSYGGANAFTKSCNNFIIYFYNKREREQSRKNVRRIVLDTAVVKNVHVSE